MSQQLKAVNPFQGHNQSSVSDNALAQSDQQRAVAEVQAGMQLAKMFPRDQVNAMDHILQSCTRPSLAKAAVYVFPRGGTTVTGPSIRLAEAIAQSWGNLQYGVRELSQEHGVSTVEAFAHDLQSNVRVTKVFQVKHQRKAKGKITTLTDPRDIYEMTANQGARRVRACILGIIPGDVTESAVNQCEVTMANNVKVDEESISNLEQAFAKYGVTTEMLSRRLGGKHLNVMIAAEMINLRNIFRSIKDGMAKPADFFEVADSTASENSLKDKLTTASANKENNKIPIDSNGEPWNPEMHATAEHGGPVYNRDGSFRARRGTRTHKQDHAMAEDPGEAQSNQGDPQFTFAEISEKLNAAENKDQVDEALSLIGGMPEDQKEEIKRLADHVVSTLSA